MSNSFLVFYTIVVTWCVNCGLFILAYLYMQWRIISFQGGMPIHIANNNEHEKCLGVYNSISTSYVSEYDTYGYTKNSEI